MKYTVDEKSRLNSSSQPPADKTPSDFWLSLRTNVRLKHQAPAIQPVSRNQNLPLSFNQERLWSLEQLQPDTSVHNILHCLHLQGELNVVALQMSLREIIRRHEILRTTFPTVDGQPIQAICPDIDWTVPIIDLQELPLEQRKTQAQRLAAEDAKQPFDLTKSPLWRIKLLRLTEQEHILVRTIHHIIFDGWSDRVFLRELGVLYDSFSQAKPSPLSELPVQYADYAHTQQQWLQGEVFSSQLDYWQNQLSGISALELPTDYPPPPVPSYQGAYQPFELSQNLTQALKKLSYQEGVSLFVTLLTLFKTLLYLYTKQEDVVICSPVVGRHQVESKGLIGYFNNIVALRTDLSTNPSFRELLHQVSHVSSEAFAHQDIPLQKVAELPHLVHTPLTRGMFVLHNTPNPSLNLDGLTVNSLYVDREIANFDLSLSLQEKLGKLTGGWQYKTDLFQATTITQMLEDFQTLLEHLVTHPDIQLSSLLQLLGKAKSNQPLSLNQITSDTQSSNPKQLSDPTDHSIEYVEPRDLLELKLLHIWQDILGIQSIGVTDNFFELGGHSLLAVRLFANIQTTFNQDLPLATLLQASTIEQLANLLRQEGWTPPSSSLIPLKSSGSNLPLFLVAPGASTALQYVPLTRCLGSNQPVYGLQAQGLEANQVIHETIEEIAAHYIQEIQTLGFDGPYMLGGRCGLGTVVAFEMAQQLQAQGKQVALLAMLDPTYQAFQNAFEKPEPTKKTLLYYIGRLICHWRAGKLLGVLRHKTSQSKITQKIVQLSDDLSDDPHVRRLQTVLQAQKKAIRNYKPQVYSGQIMLFLSKNRQRMWRYWNFKTLATQGAKRFICPTTHGNMLDEPDVQSLAEKLQACIDQASKNDKGF
ncbi:Condensation domain protein [Coleofasciculus chthonoplastes PCC 7420]|uniref:Condensation domain protein n=1 Tax=Coleofasciculus chthonoplastes PCC 7420 TaxID=118168 RepID=B4VLJ7_9CYAN|nr:condensation domain-containing protein [Coleofasciculus chthonoplastes]EDX77289.1 Condensation domain protein [Coleofasciculus chthonoplastes PCC 7420]